MADVQITIDLLTDILNYDPTTDPTDLLSRAYNEIEARRNADFDITVDIEPEKPWSYLLPEQATVSVRFTSGAVHTARAIGPEPSRNRPAMVSTTGFGGILPDDAVAYAAAITKAAEVAATLTGPTGEPS